jgi:excisionase family DNA binding protein
MQQVLLRLDEAAKSLAVSKSHLERMVARGELRAVHIGRGRRVPTSEIERWLAEQMVEPKPRPGSYGASDGGVN